MSNTAWIGIDPGAAGAVAVIWPDGRASVYDLNGSHPDTWATLREIVTTAETEHYGMFATVERVAAMPGGGERRMGATSAFNFGYGAGVLEGVLLACSIGHVAVAPQTWKAKLLPGAKGKIRGEQKALARDEARRRWPALAQELRLVRHADRAEALLLAEYGRMTHSR